MAGVRALKVVVTGDASAAQRELAKLAGAGDAMSARMRKVGTAMVSVGRNMSMFVTAPIVAGFALAAKAAAEEEQQMAVLANTLRENLPTATQATIDANEEWITSMQNATGVADGDLRDAMRHLVVSGMTLEETQAALTVAMDIAAAKGLDLETVTNAMAKANRGNVGALGRLGIATKDAEGKTLTFEQVMANAAETMGGAAATAADTAAGRAAILSVKFQDLTEKIGAILIPVLEKLATWLTKIVDWFNNLSQPMQQMVVTVGAVVAAIGPLLFIGGKVILMFSKVGAAFKALSLLLAANPWVLLIAATVALVIVIVKNWDKITAFLKRVWEGLKSAAKAAWDAIVDAVRAALQFAVNLVLNWTIVGRIIKHRDAIINVIQSLPGRIKDILGALWGIITSAFAGPIAVVKAIIAGLRSAWEDLMDAISGGTAKGYGGITPKGDLTPVGGLAAGGIVRARPGGRHARIAEAGVDEAVIPLEGPGADAIAAALGGAGGGVSTTVVQLVVGSRMMEEIVVQGTAAARRKGRL